MLWFFFFRGTSVCTYLTSRRLYFNKKIGRKEFEDFFAKYEILERELKEVKYYFLKAQCITHTIV
ncbi:hypothetical protein FC679_20215 [Bacillus cereus]|nr:hypothetical protein FC679_20215 [Bacillus cereus]